MFDGSLLSSPRTMSHHSNITGNNFIQSLTEALNQEILSERADNVYADEA